MGYYRNYNYVTMNNYFNTKRFIKIKCQNSHPQYLVHLRFPKIFIVNISQKEILKSIFLILFSFLFFCSFIVFFLFIVCKLLISLSFPSLLLRLASLQNDSKRQPVRCPSVQRHGRTIRKIPPPSPP